MLGFDLRYCDRDSPCLDQPISFPLDNCIVCTEQSSALYKIIRPVITALRYRTQSLHCCAGHTQTKAVFLPIPQYTIELASILKPTNKTPGMATLTAILSTTLLAFTTTTVSALPLSPNSTNVTTTTILPRGATAITAADLVKLAPSTANCNNAPAASECRTAAQAAPYIGISFTNFGITEFPVQAALVSLMLYETGDFKYARNHFPGVPGQGTRNMQSPAYNLKYAQWLSMECNNCGISASDVQSAQAKGPEAVLALVNSDEWGFGSAAWFLSTQCGAGVRSELAKGDDAGWAAYLGCIGTSVTDDRTKIWKSAMALGSW